MSDVTADQIEPPRIIKNAREVIYRHKLLTRVTHWINVLCISVMLFSGLAILNAHPALYWGQYGADADRPIIEFSAVTSGSTLIGKTRIGPLTLTTTGVLGASAGPDGKLIARGMPSWATLPSYQDLADGRHWHFTFAWLLVVNGLVYLVGGLINGHLRKDLAPTAGELKPTHVLKDIWDHARLKFPTGEAAKRYNILQKVAYLGVIVFIATMVLTGLTMSPGFDAVAPWLLDLFGGRQSARTLHFISASLIVAFIFVHLAMVVLAGPINEVRSMITGRYVVPQKKGAQ